jgi:aryl-alcohol dehydrogenase-like predicted oxidoreductase/enamine deaminase RidA (YjgF/YER057c/UK114 family)
MTPNHTFLAPNLKISQILTGLWQVADLERTGKQLDLDEAAKALIPYIEAGLTTFDMADHYGSSELIVGMLHKKYVPKESIQLLTKWVPPPGKVSKEAVKKAVQLSLDRMQLETLDLLQYHAWNYADPAWLDQLYYLQELRDEGLIKHLGLTNFDTAHVKMVLDSGIKIVSNQVCFSLLDQRAKQGMLDLCVEHGIKILAFGTVAGGFLSEKWLKKTEPALDNLGTWSEMKYKRFIDQTGNWQNFQNLLNTLSEISGNTNLDIANIASRYILDQSGVGGVIIGARLGKSEHIHSNLQIFENALSEIEKQALEDALKTLKSIEGDCGDEYRKPPFLTASGDLSHHIDNFPPPYATKMGKDNRTQVLSGTIWEDIAGFSRAVKKGNRIMVSGTTATHGTQVIGGRDPASQTHFILDKIEGALQSLGSRLEDVVRTRIFIRNIDDWESIARAHGARFKNIQPANTMVQANLIGEEYLIEMEVEAIVE